MAEILLALVPLLVLLASLLLGHYPGFKAIVSISERIWADPRTRAGTSQRRPRAPRSYAISGGLLLAFGFAQRPPPIAP